MILGYVIGLALVVLIVLFLFPVAMDSGKKLSKYFKSIWK